MIIRCVFVLGVVGSCCFQRIALLAAPAYEAIYAFGDSLTDTGNEPAEPLLHYQGRWSNGPLWVEYLSRRLGLAYHSGNNFARSGAQCNDTYRQVTNFSFAADISQSLCVVWAGGNDFLQEYDKHWFDDASWDDQIGYSVGNLSNAVRALHSKGARYVLVPNTVDVTEIPIINYLPGFLREYLRDKVKQFNAELAVALDGLQAALPELNLFRVDAYARMKDVLRQGKFYGFTEVNIDALSDVRLVDKRFDGPGANYLFWDPIHPTTKAHAIVADWFQAAVAPLRPRVQVTGGPAVLQLSISQLHLSRTYLLQRSTNRDNWMDLQSFNPVASSATLPLTNALPSAFFRLKWTP